MDTQKNKEAPSKVLAEIGAVGSDSTVPDNPKAVDAGIYFDGDYVGEVTLLPDTSVQWDAWDTWGSHRSHWADDELCRTFDDYSVDDFDSIVDAIRDAVTHAAQSHDFSENN